MNFITHIPSQSLLEPSSQPSAQPSSSKQPSFQPSVQPTSKPTLAPGTCTVPYFVEENDDSTPVGPFTDGSVSRYVDYGTCCEDSDCRFGSKFCVCCYQLFFDLYFP